MPRKEQPENEPTGIEPQVAHRGFIMWTGEASPDDLKVPHFAVSPDRIAVTRQDAQKARKELKALKVPVIEEPVMWIHRGGWDAAPLASWNVTEPYYWWPESAIAALYPDDPPWNVIEGRRCAYEVSCWADRVTFRASSDRGVALVTAAITGTEPLEVCHYVLRFAPPTS